MNASQLVVDLISHENAKSRGRCPSVALRAVFGIAIALLAFTGYAPAQTTATEAQSQALGAQIKAGIAAVAAQRLDPIAKREAEREMLRAVAQANANFGTGVATTIMQLAIADGMVPGDAIIASLIGAVAGGASPAPVMDTVVVEAMRSGILPGIIGNACGTAAAAIARQNPAHAETMAAAFARRGTHAHRRAFIAAIAQAGGPATLASIAGGNARALSRRGPTPPKNGENDPSGSCRWAYCN